MGDIADMMLDGTLDHETGEYLGEGDGFPRTARDMGRRKFGGMVPQKKRVPQNPKNTKCGICGKMLRGEVGLLAHTKASHSGDQV